VRSGGRGDPGFGQPREPASEVAESVAIVVAEVDDLSDEERVVAPVIRLVGLALEVGHSSTEIGSGLALAPGNVELGVVLAREVKRKLLLAGGEDVDGERVVVQQIVALGLLVDGHQDQRGFERDRGEGVDREAPGLVRSLDCDDCDPGSEAAEAGTELEGVQALPPWTRACRRQDRIRSCLARSSRPDGKSTSGDEDRPTPEASLNEHGDRERFPDVEGAFSSDPLHAPLLTASLNEWRVALLPDSGSGLRLVFAGSRESGAARMKEGLAQTAFGDVRAVAGRLPEGCQLVEGSPSSLLHEDGDGAWLAIAYKSEPLTISFRTSSGDELSTLRFEPWIEPHVGLRERLRARMRRKSRSRGVLTYGAPAEKLAEDGDPEVN